MFTGGQLDVFAYGLAAPIEKKHAVTWGFMRAVKLNLRPSAQHTVFQWDKVSWPTLRRSLAKTDLVGAVLCAKDTNAAWTVWFSSVRNIITSIVPSKLSSHRKKPLPGISTAIKPLVRWKTDAWKA